MGRDSFTFKQFTIRQDRTAMRVGTDGTLLGAWARGGKRVLDIGTGTGLVALMMAQRFPKAHITAIDIEQDAAEQAAENVANSPFAKRITMEHISLQDFTEHYNGEKFDAIVSNPPYFNDTKATGNDKRDMARHSIQLTYKELFSCSARLLSDSGTMSIVVPYSMRSLCFAESTLCKLWLLKEVNIRTKEGKPLKRSLLSFGKSNPMSEPPEEQCLMGIDNSRSRWFAELTNDFYLRG